jgi:transcriptional regulator with XRE-family HTH domain
MDRRHPNFDVEPVECGVFGYVIFKLRGVHGWTLEKLAGKTDISKGYLCGVEVGKVSPPAPPIQEKLYKVLNLSEHGRVLLRRIAFLEKAPAAVKMDKAWEELFKATAKDVISCYNLRDTSPR